MSVSILILTHDNIGNALLNAAKKTLGQLPLSAVAIPVPCDCETERLIPKLKCIVQTLNQGKGILVLTDLYGSTPSNLADTLRDEIAVRVVAGVNLPMLIRVMNYPSLDLEMLAAKAMSGGRDGVLDCCQYTFPTYRNTFRNSLKGVFKSLIDAS